ncbi:hypothetical protein PQI23_05685 [Leucobacter sp. USCH14]|uniref:hypothetical protein n=1 Tax=Leucobacter sp. USCH14 TaxID=3024838 RepID=UPI00309AB125
MSIAQFTTSGSERTHRSGDAARARLLELVSHLDADRMDSAEALLSDLLAHQNADTRALTGAEVSVLARFGVSEAALQRPDELRASAQGVLADRSLGERSATVTEAAEMLGVTPARVRQRCAAGTLLAQRRSDGWHLPRFQFPEDREVPGWATIAAVIPRGTPLLFAERVLTSPAPALMNDGEELAPFEWLLQGGDPASAARAVDDALHRLP